MELTFEQWIARIRIAGMATIPEILPKGKIVEWENFPVIPMNAFLSRKVISWYGEDSHYD